MGCLAIPRLPAWALSVSLCTLCITSWASAQATPASDGSTRAPADPAPADPAPAAPAPTTPPDSVRAPGAAPATGAPNPAPNTLDRAATTPPAAVPPSNYPPVGSYPAGYPPPAGYPAYPQAPGYSGTAYYQSDPRPKYLPYRAGQAAPAGYQFDEEARRGPLIGGLITLGVPYLLGLLIAAQENYSNKKGFLVVPGLGPWLTLISRDSTCDPTLPINSCDEDFAARFALVLDGLLQTTGGALFAYGLFNTKKRYVRSDWAPKSSLVVTPRWIGRSPGIGVLGAF